MRKLVMIPFAALLLAQPATAENWVDLNELYEYDSDSVSAMTVFTYFVARPYTFGAEPEWYAAVCDKRILFEEIAPGHVELFDVAVDWEAWSARGGSAYDTLGDETKQLFETVCSRAGRWN